jgi:hypothetical protein
MNPQALNRYSYVLNNPLRYTDPTGHGWWSIVTDIASIAFDIQQMVSEPSWGNAGWLTLDVALTCLPVIPAGAGPLAKGAAKVAQVVGKGGKVVKGVDKVVEGTKDAEKVIKTLDNVEDAATALNKSGSYLHRPYIRKATREAVEAGAAKKGDKFLDANTEEIIEGDYQLGHKPGYEYSKYEKWAEERGMTQEEFNDMMNNPDIYQIEDPISNMSHQFEAPDNVFYGGR